MSKSITIPSGCGNPVVVVINGVKYIYPAGSEQTVPDEVAALLETNAKEAVIYGRRATAPLETEGLYNNDDYISLYVNDKGQLRIRKSDVNALIPDPPAPELPEAPDTDGTYALTMTVADGEATLSWEAVPADDAEPGT